MRPFRTIAAFVAACAIPLAAAASGHAQELRGEIESIVRDYLATHPDEVGQIVKDYLVRHPEALQEALVAVLKKRAQGAAANAAPPAAAADKTALIESHAAELFNSPRQVTLGDPHGDVTLVEFFDYNCGYCKRALADTLDLLKQEPGLKLVLKELPILGPGSLDAARVAVAVRMQDADGAKYLEFHRRLLGARGAVNREQALAVASDVGLDMARLQRDMTSDEVDKSIEESRTLARALGLNGTPGYVVGKQVIMGAIGLTALGDQVRLARK